jgi:L-ribulose-5-phosphate 3-epimerase
MYLGYNTNGLAHHALKDAIRVIHEIGYEGIAITLDHASLNPFGASLDQQLLHTRQLLEQTDLRTVVETGARFLLDPRCKHHPTLVSASPTDRARRVDFLRRAIDIAAELGSDCVSFWSGRADDDAGPPVIWDRLAHGLLAVVAHAKSCQVAIGFEPEPNMFIDTMDQFAELRRRLDIDSDHLKLTLDLGHLHCQGETPIEDRIREWAKFLVNVHIEDMRHGVHEHLMLGEGEMNFGPILSAFQDCQYEGGVFVELSRHSHVGPIAAQEAFDFLSARLPHSKLDVEDNLP